MRLVIIAKSPNDFEHQIELDSYGSLEELLDRALAVDELLVAKGYRPTHPRLKMVRTNQYRKIA